MARTQLLTRAVKFEPMRPGYDSRSSRRPSIASETSIKWMSRPSVEREHTSPGGSIVMFQMRCQVVESELPLGCGRLATFVKNNALSWQCDGYLDHTSDFKRGVGYSHVQRALKDVSTALVGTCLPLPNFSLAFCEILLQCAESGHRGTQSTVKSAALSFFFFELFGIFETAF